MIEPTIAGRVRNGPELCNPRAASDVWALIVREIDFGGFQHLVDTDRTGRSMSPRRTRLDRAGEDQRERQGAAATCNDTSSSTLDASRSKGTARC